MEKSLNKTDILSRLNYESFYAEHLPSLSGQGDERKALCPFHNDKTPSLSVNIAKGIFNCFTCGDQAQGDVIEFVKKLKGLDFKEALIYLADRAGMPQASRGNGSAAKSNRRFTMESIKARTLKGDYAFIRIHHYEKAEPSYIKAIYRNKGGDKQARFYTLMDRNKGLYIDKRTATPVLYNQKALEGVNDKSTIVFFVEGEKDCDTLAGLGLIAITAGGVNDWRSEFAQFFKDLNIAIFPDNDLPGRKHADQVAASIRSQAASIKIVSLPGLPDKGDISDFVEARRREGQSDNDIRQNIEKLVKAADPLSSTLWLAQPSDWRYTIDDGGNLCKLKEDNNFTRLCNFDAAITQEIIEDDGTEKAEIYYIIEGRKGPVTLHPLEVPHSKFEALAWHRLWGAQTVIEPGIRVKDLIRHAIDTRASDRITRRVYAHTGWRKIGDSQAYLTAAGAIGAERIEIKLPDELKRYNVPVLPENETDAIKASLDFLDIAAHKVTFPLFLMTYLSPLTSILMPLFSGYLYGERDTYKTTLATLALSHFGDFSDKFGLPNFSDTAASVQYRAFILKDVLMVVDDLHPSANKYDSDKMQALLQNVIRSAGNRTGRGRLNSEAKPQARYYPRGMMLITAEKLPSVQSTRTRTMTIEVTRGDVNLDKLSELQRKAFLLPNALSSFVHWLKDNLEDIKGKKNEWFIELRKAVSKENSFKLAEHVSYLLCAASLTCNWLIDRRAISAEKATEFIQEAQETFRALSREQNQLIEEEDPICRFIEIFNSLLHQGEIRIAHRYSDVSTKLGSIDGKPIGFYDESWLYLMPEPLFTALDIRCRATGGSFPIDRTTLFKTLKNRNMTKTSNGRTTIKFRPTGGQPINVLQLKRECLSMEKVGTLGTKGNNEENYIDESES